MPAPAVGTITRCALCGSGLTGPEARGAEPHAVMFRTRGASGGILLCDECATLAHMPLPLRFD